MAADGSWRSALAVLAVAAVASGCTSAVTGTAVRAQDGPRPGETLLTERGLDRILLSADELGDALDSPSIQITDEIDVMADDSNGFSRPDCLGAVFDVQKPVYELSGYTAVLTRLASESGDAYEHWVEENAVVLPSAETARSFFEDSARAWQDCANTTVTIGDGVERYDWYLQGLVRGDSDISQVSTTTDLVDWQCQHAMAPVSNVVIEASVCRDRIGDEATTLMTELVAKAGQ